MPYKEVWVEDNLDDYEDQELIDEIENRGWVVGEEKHISPQFFTDIELDYITNMLIDQTHGVGREIYEKAKKHGN